MSVGARRRIAAQADLLLVVAAAGVLRAAVFAVATSSPQRFWSQDDREYLAVADHLRAAYGAGPGALFDIGLRRTPGYPLFLRAIFEVFGRHYAAVVAVQLVVSVATVAVTFWVARMLLPRRVAVLAAGLLAVDPASVVFANQMLTESLFTLLLLVAIGLLVRSRQIDSTPVAVAAGAVVAVAMLVRPVAEYLPAVLVVVLLLVARGTIPPRRTVALALAFVVGFAVPGGAWLLRNYERTGVPIVSTIDGHNMLQYRAVGALVESGQPRQLAQHDVLVRLAPHIRPGENAARVSRAELRVGLTILGEHPLGAFKDWAKGEARLLLGPARTETAVLLTGRESVEGSWLRALTLLDQLVTVAILLLALAGAIGLALGRLPARSLWLLVSAAAYLVIISGGHEAYSRFRVPVTPFLAVLAAAAVPMWRRRRAGER